MTNLHTAILGKPPAYRYHLLRNALETFQKNLPQLDEHEFDRVCQRADRSFHLETLALESPEASQVAVPPTQVDAAVQEIANRYPDDHDFTSDLSQNGLTPDTLRQALQRELMFSSVLGKVASRSIDINDIDVQLYYEMNRDRFMQPETRGARHILITINDEYPENSRDNALQRIRKIATQTGNNNPKQFGKLARQYSECPTAMEGGKLGIVPRGQLFPQLDAALFQMGAGQVSQPLESAIGFHLLLCEHIYPARQVALTQARPQIRALLQERAQRNCQKAWLKQLEASAPTEV
ncbi:MAG: nitrogen fixation protein NifM [Gammaproteobacteria bacterium]|nr:nitrogen fixation protein NifM [Gammaproteobacteria bacterium]MBU1724134.1 nitrogen fixation protein NifM [Gammaproteobacteria bacterium]MBU2006417.1 nitrogen fixation protein NifM [Gammaproteobacteria bacterium]